MELNDKKLGAIVIFGALLSLGYGLAPLTASTVTTPTTGYYSTCDISGQVGVVITGCSGLAAGGNYEVFVNFLGSCGIAAPTFTFYWPGQDPVTSTNGLSSFQSSATVETMQFTITGPGVNAGGSITIYTQSGNSTFTDNFTNTVTSCTTTTSTSTSTTSTTTTGPGGHGQSGSPNYEWVVVGLMLLAIGTLFVKKGTR